MTFQCHDGAFDRWLADKTSAIWEVALKPRNSDLPQQIVVMERPYPKINRVSKAAAAPGPKRLKIVRPEFVVPAAGTAAAAPAVPEAAPARPPLDKSRPCEKDDLDPTRPADKQHLTRLASARFENSYWFQNG